MRRWLKWVMAVALLLRMFGPRFQPTFRPPQEHPLRVPGRTVFVGDDEYLVREMGPAEGVPVLLVHGLAGSSLTEWYQVAPKLAVDRRVIMIDHRGHGLSARADIRFDVADDADDLTGVLDALGIALAANGQPDEAVSTLRTAVEYGPDDGPARLTLGRYPDLRQRNALVSDSDRPRPAEMPRPSRLARLARTPMPRPPGAAGCTSAERRRDRSTRPARRASRSPGARHSRRGPR